MKYHMSSSWAPWYDETPEDSLDLTSMEDAKMGNGGATTLDDAWQGCDLRNEEGTHNHPRFPFSAHVNSRPRPANEEREMPTSTPTPMDHLDFLCKYGGSSGMTIEQCYRRQAKKLHPDRNGGNSGPFIALKRDYDNICSAVGADARIV